MFAFIKKLAVPIAIAVILLFVLFSINQLAGLYSNLLAINETLALVVTVSVALILLALLLVPFIIYFTLPESINYNENRPDAYKKQIIARLKKNKIIRQHALALSSDEELEQAISILDAEAEKVINETATSVFLTTAVSQNGKLDALTVFITQSRMVWKVAHIYWQRPSIKDLLKLYANVGATSLIATEVENIDITRQVEPIINAVLKSPGRSIPVVGHAAHIITDSLLEGSTNAFLTLRVGVITKRYCGSLRPIDQKQLKRNAFAEASGLLRKLVIQSSGKVVTSIYTAIKNAGKSSIQSGLDSVGKAATSVKTKVGSWIKKDA